MNKILFLFLILTYSLRLYSQVDTFRQTVAKFEKEITLEVSLNYLVYLPQGYENDDKKWPMLLFLHGAGERGNDLNYLKRLGPPMLIEQGKDFPFIVISPQCPLEQRWDAKDLSAFLDGMEETYRIDKTRIYVSGLSMGGEGTWKMIMAEPERFAAAAPVCGRTGSSYLDACRLQNLPIWIFHGAMDDVVSIDESIRMIKALDKCSSNVKFTVYPRGNHNAWDETYNNDELYNWLLEHHLNKTENYETN